MGVIECSTLEFTALPFRWCLTGSLRLTRNWGGEGREGRAEVQHVQTHRSKSKHKMQGVGALVQGASANEDVARGQQGLSWEDSGDQVKGTWMLKVWEALEMTQSDLWLKRWL